MTMCSVSGCGRRTTGHSRYCNSHKTRSRRHGHPKQGAVTKAELKPYRKAVAEWMDVGDRWSKVLPVWDGLVRWAHGVRAVRLSGKPMCRFTADMAAEVLHVAADVEAKDVVEVVAGMCLMEEGDRRRFRSDDAFRVQVARRFRGLTETNAGCYWDQAEGRMKRVYRDPSPRVSVMLGQVLVERLGVVGVYVHRARERDDEARRVMVRALAEEVGDHA